MSAGEGALLEYIEDTSIFDLDAIDRQLELLAGERFSEEESTKSRTSSSTGKPKNSTKKIKKQKKSTHKAAEEQQLVEYADDDDDDSVKIEAAKKSTRILAQMRRSREVVKHNTKMEEEQRKLKMRKSKLEKEQQWKQKLQNSPFAVDLVAEAERVDEEAKLKQNYEEKMMLKMQKQREKLRNDIVVKALQESSDLEALRNEKRLILEEEKRLKALILVQKTKANKKEDLSAAMRAEKQRKEIKLEYRRQKRMEFENYYKEQARQALMEKHGLV